MRLNFKSYGAGPPLIILHGLFGSLDNWHSISRRLAEFYRVLALDQRNHGGSPHSAEMDYRLMAQDVGEFMEAQGLERAHVLGHSMGGKTAMQFALDQPEKVDRLVVVDVAPRAYSPGHGEIFAGALSLDLAACQERGQLDEALAPFIPERVVRQFLLKSVTRDAGGAFRWKLNLRGIFRNYERLCEALPTDRLFDHPALFIRGGQSGYIRGEDWEPLRRLFPKAELQTIQSAGHWVHAEAPEAFGQAVLGFLAQAKS
jgi:pimeloyl-ACP methyl ester carboxylesterase